MEEGEVTSRVSRRRLLKRMGVGAAVAWLTPIATSLGSAAEAGCVGCEAPCDWTCGGTLRSCGSDCYCSPDVDGNCFCWANAFCSEVTDCVSNADCPPGYSCIPGTCCFVPKCLAGCGLGPRPRRRHGKMVNGRVR